MTGLVTADIQLYADFASVHFPGLGIGRSFFLESSLREFTFCRLCT